ncbi:MAG: hypothetical protein VB096_06085 [Pseudoflavonifractor sp.]|nr:hypothetical protein [Pseudoflavonifractor sp.]
MRAEKRFFAGAGIGLTSIFTVLLVMVLSVFTALSLFTARADERLSRANADAVNAYYAADARACQIEADFAISGEAARVETIPMTEIQSLRIHLRRAPDGSVERLEWRTVRAEKTGDTDTLPVWNGTGLPGA